MKKKLIQKSIKTDRIMLLEKMSIIENYRNNILIFGVGNIGGHGKDIVNFFERVGDKHVG